MSVYVVPGTRTVYLSGPMSGIPNDNRAAFAVAADWWRSRHWDVISPPELNDARSPLASYAELMRMDLNWLLRADAVAVLPRWEQSRGATLEVRIARVLDLPVYDAQTEQLIGPGTFEDLDWALARAVGWADETFRRDGRDRRPAIAAHLSKEAKELRDDPVDFLESIDCLFLVAHHIHTGRQNGQAQTAAEGVTEKLTINKARTWGEPDADGVIEHVR